MKKPVVHLRGRLQSKADVIARSGSDEALSVFRQSLFRYCCYLGGCLLLLFLLSQNTFAAPTAEQPLETHAETKEVQIFGVIYPRRFNAAEGEETHYHLLVWRGGTSVNALIETPADDLAFHDALRALGAQPGDNLTMASWNKRHDPDHPAPRKKVIGSSLNIRISWDDKPSGIPIAQAFRIIQKPTNAALLQSPIPSPQFLAPRLEWRFGGNRDRWFNTIPLAPRPGCLACLYSCPSGKVSNGALSIHDYLENPSRFEADLNVLPSDGTPVIVTFRVEP
jgi:hypothetical protein